MEIYKQIFEKLPYYVFIVNKDVKVLYTNYYILNPDFPRSEINLLGNVLGCKNACDATECGLHDRCNFCLIRASIVKSYLELREFNNVETHMQIYIAPHLPIDIDVSVSARFIEHEGEQLLMVTMEDITTYKQVQRHLLSKEYQRNVILNRAGVIRKFLSQNEDFPLREEMKKIFNYETQMSSMSNDMVGILNTQDRDSRSLLHGIQIVCRDNNLFKFLFDVLHEKYRIYQTLTLDEDLSTFIYNEINAMIITPDISYDEAGRLVDTIWSIRKNTPVLRIINPGDIMAGNYTQLLFTPVTPTVLTDVLKQLEIEGNMRLK